MTSDAEKLASRIADATLAVHDVLTIYLGEKLGFYDDLARHGPSTPSELGARTGTHERYVREWLEQQAAAEILGCEDPAAPAAETAFLSPARRRRGPDGARQPPLVRRDGPAASSPSRRSCRL